MSVATKSYVSTYGKNQHTDEMAQRPPRSPAENYMQSNPKTNTTQESTLKRPNQEDDSQHREKRQKMEVSQSDRMDVDEVAAPTNHDRQEETKGKNTLSSPSKPSSTLKDDFVKPFLLCKSCKLFMLQFSK